MNKTKIDWADMTWNPVTGCLHDCEYCYARRIAVRFGGNFSMARCTEHGFLELDWKPDNPYPDKFSPTFHRYRLDEPKRKSKGKTIFVCSMADLFGDWVPDKWIQEIFKACENAPQHRYLFLTKNPKRYREIIKSPIEYRKNRWFGTTATDTESFNANGEEMLCHHINGFSNTFMSIEPLLQPIDGRYLHNIKYLQWVIIGAETGNRKDKVTPKKEWIDSIAEQCKSSDIPLFMKESLRELMGEDFIQEFPWEVSK